VVKPWVLITLPRTVNRIIVLYLLLIIVRVIVVIVFPLVLKLRFNAQASQAMRLANKVIIVLCLREIISYFTLRKSIRGI
jgi:hypothetical protein